MSHYPEYEAILTIVYTFSKQQLLEQLDCLWGQDSLSDNPTYEEVLEEVLEQLDIEFTIIED